MEVYFVKSVACLAISLLFYKLLLEKENMHVFKRFYLLTAMVAAVAIPFLTFTTYVEPSPEIYQPLRPAPVEGTVETPVDLLKFLEIGLWVIYILGVFFFSIKFIRNLHEILLRIKRNPKLKENHFIHVLLTERLNPHTFLSYIFLNKLKYEKQEIPKEVIIHEQTHAKQKHSIDILLLELAQIIFWFNPLLFLLKDAIKLNHEFLADESVLKKGTNPTGYKKTLLSYSSGGLESGLVNPINYSSIKKRFTVMKTKTSKTAVWARSLLVLPLLAVLVYGFSTSEVVVKAQDQKQNMDSGETSDILISEDINVYIFRNGDITVNHQTVKLDGLEERLEKINRHLSIEKRKELTSANVKVEPGVKMGIITDVKMLLMKYGVKGIEVSEPATSSPDQESNIGLNEELEKLEDLMVNYNRQEKATPEMVAEYNKMAKHYNSRKEAPIIKMKDYERMEYIYNLMTPDQKKKAESFPVPSPPPPPNKKMVAEYNKLAKQFNSSPKGDKIFQIEDYNKLANIYRLMSPEQKAAAEPFPKIEVIEVIEDKSEVIEVMEEEMEILEVLEEQIELIEVVEKQKATPEMISEYNKLAKSYNNQEITEKVVQEKGFQRMLYIFGLMTESQRKKAERLPPPPPPAPAEEAIPAPPQPPLVEDLPQPPPPPPPVTFEELVKDGATFFYNGIIIKPEEARKLVEVEKKVNVHITSTNNEKPVVRLTDKKDKN